MRENKYIRASSAMEAVLAGGCGECKMRRSEYCKGCRTQEILDLLDDVTKTEAVEIPQRHGRLIDAEILIDSIMSIVLQHCDSPRNVTINANTILQMVDHTPTIISSDKENVQ